MKGKVQGIKDRVSGGSKPDPQDHAEHEAADGADVKAAVTGELASKSVSNAEDASALIGDLYARYSPRGLKGIGIVPSADGTSVAVRVNASPTDTVANLPVNKKGLREALSWAYRFAYNKGRTQLYVTYDGGRSLAT